MTTGAHHIVRSETKGTSSHTTAENDPSSGVDIGILLLRIVLAGTMGAHGLQKLFGLFDGPGIDGFARALSGFGFTSQTTLLAWVTALSEVGGSVLILFGVLTPLGAAAVLGVALNMVYLLAPTGFFMGPETGFEFELLLGVVALALLFTGAGRYALDRNTPWGRSPLRYGLGGIGLAVISSAAVILLFR